MNTLTSDLVARIGYFIDDCHDRARCLESSSCLSAITANFTSHFITCQGNINKLEDFQKHMRYLLKIKPELSYIRIVFRNVLDVGNVGDKRLSMPERVSNVSLCFYDTSGEFVQNILKLFDLNKKYYIYCEVQDLYNITFPDDVEVKIKIARNDLMKHPCMKRANSLNLVTDNIRVLDLSEVVASNVQVILSSLNIVIIDIHKITTLTVGDNQSVIGSYVLTKQLESCKKPLLLQCVYTNYYYPFTCQKEDNIWYHIINKLSKNIKYYFSPIGDPTFMIFLQRCKQLGAKCHIWCYCDQHYIEACMINLLYKNEKYDLFINESYEPPATKYVNVLDAYNDLSHSAKELYFWVKLLHCQL